MKSIVIGSRESILAKHQAELVIEQLRQKNPGLDVTLKTFTTKGDEILDKPLADIGDKGLFVKELEVALLNKDIDVAIHSMKDMPGDLPDGLTLTSVSKREDPRDVLLSNQNVPFLSLPKGAKVGTSSIRRLSQLKFIRPDLLFESIRGNLNTRLKKMEEGQYDAIVLAAAGVHRLSWSDKIATIFDPLTECMPAVCQGILGAEYRGDDIEVLQVLKTIQHDNTQTAMLAERQVLTTLGAGCHVPLGALAVKLEPHATKLEANDFILSAVVITQEGERILRERSFAPREAEKTGKQIAYALNAFQLAGQST